MSWIFNVQIPEEDDFDDFLCKKCAPLVESVTLHCPEIVALKTKSLFFVDGWRDKCVCECEECEKVEKDYPFLFETEEMFEPPCDEEGMF